MNPHPLYSLSENKSEAIAHVSPPQNWVKFTNVVPIQPSDVMYLIARKPEVETLRSKLPRGYENIRIVETDD